MFIIQATEKHNATPRVATVIRLSVIMLSAIRLSVVAPISGSKEHYKGIDIYHLDNLNFPTS